MNDEHDQNELVDEEIQAEPVIDEFILFKLAESAELDDRLRQSKYELAQFRAEADERDRVRAEAQFAEARRQHPGLSPEAVAELLDRHPYQYVTSIHAIQD